MSLVRELQVAGDKSWQRSLDGWIRDVREILNGGWRVGDQSIAKSFEWDPDRSTEVFISLPELKAKPRALRVLSVESTPRETNGFAESGGRIRWQWVEATRRRPQSARIVDVGGLLSGSYTVWVEVVR